MIAFWSPLHQTKLKKNPIQPIANLERLTGGYHEITSELMWVDVLQDFDFCENSESPKAYNSGNNLDEALSKKVSESRCHLGWVYQMLDMITNLTPRREMIYSLGGVNLAVVVDDREGARRLLEKGLRQYPGNFNIAFRLAYIYIFEIKEPKRAADLLLQASQNGGPDWLPALAAGLYSRAGQVALGKAVLKEYLDSNPDDEGRERAEKRLREIEATEALKDK